MTVANELSHGERPIHKPNKFAVFWIACSSIVVFWDLSFLFARPHSFKSMNGKLAFLWPGYDLYEFIDKVYSVSSWEKKLGFPAAQATMNVVENMVNFLYLYLAHSDDDAKRAAAPVAGLVGVTMTCSKTILYFLCDYYCGMCESGSNDWKTWLTLYILPNCLWVLIPGSLAVYFGLDIADRLKLAAGVNGSPYGVGPAGSTRSRVASSNNKKTK